MNYDDSFGLAACDVSDMSDLARKSNPDMNVPTPSMERMPDYLGRPVAGAVGPWPWSKPVVNSKVYGGKLTPEQRVDLYDTIVHEAWHYDKQDFYNRNSAKSEREATSEAANRTLKLRDEILKGGAGSCGGKK